MEYLSVKQNIISLFHRWIKYCHTSLMVCEQSVKFMMLTWYLVLNDIWKCSILCWYTDIVFKYVDIHNFEYLAGNYVYMFNQNAKSAC